jgi:TolB-like protein
VRRARPAVPEAVEQAVTRALAVVPADRWASASDFARALMPAAAPAAPAPAASAATTVAPAQAASTPIRGRRLSPALATLVLGFALGLGLLFAWRRSHSPGEEPTGARLVAVLPFENLGSPDDEYFADGITDEVRGKLSALAGLRVIAGGSSKEYKKSDKTLPAIAAELGVEYLLVAKVRWARAVDGTSRVRVSPELVQVTGGTPTVRWQQPFEAALTDVFKVQADIAGQVAGALDLALGSDQKQQLAERPTQNLAAYDAYLRGRSIVANEPAALRRKIGLLDQAVSLDSTFADAWSELSGALGLLYSNSVPDPAVAARAKAAVDRALVLDPEGSSGHAALSRFYMAVRKDAPAAEQEIALALRAAPNDALLLSSAASVERSLGRYDAALTHLQQARRLDPRSVRVVNGLQNTLLWLRRYPEALEASEAALALAPGDLSISQDKAMVYVAQGNLAAAREVIKQVSPTVQPAALAAFFGNYWDMYWVLDEPHQQLLLGLDSTAFDGDRSAWGTVLMQLHELRGNHAKARVYADSAYAEGTRQLRVAPDDPQRRVISGLQLAYLGRKAEAIAAGLQGAAISPISRDAINGPYYQHLMARIYLLSGEPEKALDMLEPLLKMPYFLSPGWLRIDPTWAALKGNPRFERMITGS